MIDTTLPNIGDRWKELLLPISNDEQIREEITNELKSAFEQKWGVQQNFDRIKKKFNRQSSKHSTKFTTTGRIEQNKNNDEQ